MNKKSIFLGIAGFCMFLIFIIMYIFEINIFFIFIISFLLIILGILFWIIGRKKIMKYYKIGLTMGLLIFIIQIIFAIYTINNNKKNDNRYIDYVDYFEDGDWIISGGYRRLKVSYFDSIPTISVRILDQSQTYEVTVEVIIGYAFNDENAYAELNRNTHEIWNFFQEYFSKVTIEDIEPKNEEMFRKEICEQIKTDFNDILRVRDIFFYTLDIKEVY